ncbi:MAG TPA: MBL fold metallo-hydrolase [Thermoleophilia bacterium]|nr:MBL fold metallo-hydrolase [Thermoleophilia bacterium]
MIRGSVEGRHLQLYLLLGEDRIVLIDSGTAHDPSAIIEPYLQRIGLNFANIDLVLVTHADMDHSGGAGVIKQASPGTLLACPERDRAMVEDPALLYALRYDKHRVQHGIAYDQTTKESVLKGCGNSLNFDLTFVGGETIRLGRDWSLQVYASPGHTDGHLSVFDTKNKIIFSSDAIQGTACLGIDGKPNLCPVYVSVESYEQTLRLLGSLEVEVLCTAHWPTMRGDAIRSFLDQSRGHVGLVDRLISEQLSSRREGATLKELVCSLGESLGDWPREMDSELAYSFSAHLERQMKWGSIRLDALEAPVRFYFVS